ncbi:MAG TPA: hypothetical protein VIV60_03920, partial [Polyangiaceae bacterium]
MVVLLLLLVTENIIETKERERYLLGEATTEIQGRKVRYHLSKGPKHRPLVVLIPGWSAGADLGEPLINSLDAPVMSYDPCGVALSDQVPGGCDAERHADELSLLLD